MSKYKSTYTFKTRSVSLHEIFKEVSRKNPLAIIERDNTKNLAFVVHGSLMAKLAMFENDEISTEFPLLGSAFLNGDIEAFNEGEFGLFYTDAFSETCEITKQKERLLIKEVKKLLGYSWPKEVGEIVVTVKIANVGGSK